MKIHFIAAKIRVQGAICKERHLRKYPSRLYVICEHSGWICDAIYIVHNLHVLEPISRRRTRENKMVNLCSYVSFCCNIMCPFGPINNLWLTYATEMDTNGCDMPNNDSSSALCLGNKGCCGSAWGQNKELKIL